MGQQMKEQQEREAAKKALKDVSMTFDIQASENELSNLFEAARDGLADRDEIFAEKVQDTIDRLEEVTRSAVADRDTTLSQT